MMNVEWLWIKDTDGNPSSTLSFAVVAFILVFVKVLLGGVPIEFAGSTFTLLPIDGATIGALLTPTLGAYVARRYTTAKFVDLDGDGVNDLDEPHGKLVAEPAKDQKAGDNG